MLGATLDLNGYLARFCDELKRIDPQEVDRLSEAIYNAYRQGRFVFICGNGGSGANASHLCEDLGKSTLRRDDFDNDRVPRLKVMSLTDNTPYILAWANDEGYERIFVEQLKNFAGPGDVLLAISGSGNSPNVLRAVEWANRKGLVTFGITGYSGGKLRQLAQHGVHVPLDDMGMVESVHLVLFHYVLGEVYARINREGKYEQERLRAAG
jgi:D-sedoheptulose 7-phosphate isomerase